MATSEGTSEGCYIMGSHQTKFRQVMHDIGFQSRTTMMKEIAHVRFTALTFLLLSGNNIQSIEELPCLDMVHLR